MAHRTSIRLSDPGRRRLILAASASGLVGLLQFFFSRRAICAQDYANSVAALKKGVVTETAAHYRYVQFGRLAKRDGYRGLAYLYTALATSELIHAQNYARVLAMFGVAVEETEQTEIPTGTAKENLIYAAERELKSIEDIYPSLLEAVAAEGHTDVVQAIRYSWASHRQHLGIIEKIRRWTPEHFESVTRKIDKNADRYFVCQICGSTVTTVPDKTCPVCKEPASSYRLIPHDRFF